MARKRSIEMRLPDADLWLELKRDLGLNEEQISTLNTILERAEELLRGTDAGPTDAEIKKALGKLDRGLTRLAAVLKSRDVVDALGVIEGHGCLGELLSPTIAAQIDTAADIELKFHHVQQLLEHHRYLGEPLRASDLDQLSIQHRRWTLNHQTAKAMAKAVEQMRQPISTWLRSCIQDKGGNRPRSDRELLIFLLARDAPLLIDGAPKASAADGKFKDLCTRVLNACQVNTDGLEDAIERCLEKYSAWLKWYALPTLSSSKGQTNDAS